MIPERNTFLYLYFSISCGGLLSFARCLWVYRLVFTTLHGWKATQLRGGECFIVARCLLPPCFLLKKESRPQSFLFSHDRYHTYIYSQSSEWTNYDPVILDVGSCSFLIISISRICPTFGRSYILALSFVGFRVCDCSTGFTYVMFRFFFLNLLQAFLLDQNSLHTQWLSHHLGLSSRGWGRHGSVECENPASRILYTAVINVRPK